MQEGGEAEDQGGDGEEFAKRVFQGVVEGWRVRVCGPLRAIWRGDGLA